MDHTRRATTLVTLTALSLGVLGLVHEAHARPTCGRIEQTEAYKPQNLWPRAIQPDPRAELLVPVNVVRIYSDEHSADLMAPRAWITAQLELANRLYRFSDPDMASYGGSRLAPCVQFTLNRVYDVHEREVSETLGYAFDTELVYGAAPTGNGERKVGTRDLRTLKVTDGTQYLTVFCVWEMKNPLHEASGIGGEANIGFASRLPTGPRRVLTKVTAARARMGVVTTRRQAAWMNNLAHEFGHYFGLFHAWEHARNQQRGIRDLGSGPQGHVDPDRNYGNVMDYDNGSHVKLYFTRSQLNSMYQFTKTRARTQIFVQQRSSGGGAPPPTPALAAAAQVKRVWLDQPSAGGPVVVHAHLQVDNIPGKKGYAVAWFYDSTGQKLRDADGTFHTGDGQVSASIKARPLYPSAKFHDCQVFIPYSQLHLRAGVHELAVDVGIFLGATRLSQRAAPVRFQATWRK